MVSNESNDALYARARFPKARRLLRAQFLGGVRGRALQHASLPLRTQFFCAAPLAEVRPLFSPVADAPDDFIHGFEVRYVGLIFRAAAVKIAMTHSRSTL